MKRSIVLNLLLSLAVLACAKAAVADQSIEEIQSAASDGLIRIKNARGNIEIYGWDKDEIEINGNLDDLAKKLVFHVSGRKTLIEVKMPRLGVNWGDGSDLEIRVPKHSRIDASGVSSEFSATGILGGIRIKSVSGDLEIKEVEGQIILGSISGKISSEDTRGELHVSSISGDLEIEEHQGKVFAESVSGDLSIDLKETSGLIANNISGETDIEVDALNNAAIKIVSVSGDIELDLPADADAVIELKVGMGGDISDGLTSSQVKESITGKKVLKTVMGTGASKVLIRSIMGDVRLDDG